MCDVNSGAGQLQVANVPERIGPNLVVLIV